MRHGLEHHFSIIYGDCRAELAAFARFAGLPILELTRSTTPDPVLERLGFPHDARLVIFHVDDVGMCHGSNHAYLELHEAGIVKTGSLMAPCPWSHEMLAISAGSGRTLTWACT